MDITEKTRQGPDMVGKWSGWEGAKSYLKPVEDEEGGLVYMGERDSLPPGGWLLL